MIITPGMRRMFDRLHATKTRSPKYRHWRELEESQYLPREILLERQWKRFLSIVRFSCENNPFYRKRFQDMGLQPGHIRNPHDVSLIPILTKKEIRENLAEMISDGFPMDSLLTARTGGSTGVPLELHVTVECNEMRNACARRHDRWSGWEVGEPIGSVWGNPKRPKTIKEVFRNRLLFPQIFLDTMEITERSVKEFAMEWQKIRPTLLFGHAHSLYVLSCFVKDMDISQIRPKAILSTSMLLLDHERKVIEDVFEAQVYNRYGCEEVGLVASECEMHRGMHLNIEHLYIEFVKDDGSYAGPGETGKIILTDLINRSMPLIRYQLEDIGIPIDRDCSCGRGLPLMEKVTGRTADFLVKKGGVRIAGISLIENTLTKIKGIEQMQIIQESLHHIILKIICGTEFDEDTSGALTRYFTDLFGADTVVEIQMVDMIPVEENGKYRFSICRVRDALGATDRTEV